MFVDRSNAATIDAAIDAGVSAYIVDGLRKDRVKPILDMTISRFNAFAKLKKELETCAARAIFWQTGAPLFASRRENGRAGGRCGKRKRRPSCLARSLLM
jgi:hypothetical protein